MVKKQPLHTRFKPGEILTHVTDSEIYLEILRVLPGGYEVYKIVVPKKGKFQLNDKDNLPKLHVHNYFGHDDSINFDKLRLIRKLYEN